MREARASAVPLDFSLQQHDTPNEGVIQLMPHRLPIGVVNRRLDPFSEDESARDAVVIETGGELVASLSFMGHVHFIAHPRQSDRSTPKTKEIILAGPLDPTDVTPAVIRAVLRKYLLILRSSSVLGMEDTISVMERAQILWIYFADLRKTTLDQVYPSSYPSSRMRPLCLGVLCAVRLPQLEHAIDTLHAGGGAGELPAGRRQRGGARSAASLPGRHRNAQALKILL